VEERPFQGRVKHGNHSGLQPLRRLDQSIQQVCAADYGSLLAGAAIFVATFFVWDFTWTHFVVTDPAQIGSGDGVMVIGGSLLTGTVLGLAAMIFILYRYWPKRT